jgi:hypothetical protein
LYYNYSYNGLPITDYSSTNQCKVVMEDDGSVTLTGAGGSGGFHSNNATTGLLIQLLVD